MRVTAWHMYNTFLNDLHSVQDKMSKSQNKLSSQQEISKPSDDPFGTSQILGFDAQLEDVESYKRNVSDAMGMLDMTDSALDGVGSAMRRIRDLIVQGSNGTNDQNALNAIASEIQQLKGIVQDRSNTQYGDMYLFSGTATTTQPYPANLYVGNAGAINRRVAPGLQVQLNVPGDVVFGTTTGPLPSQMNVFDLIDQVVTDLQTGTPATLQQLRSLDLQAIDTNLANISQQRSLIGTTQARLEVNEQQLSDLEQRLTDSRSKIADADMAKTMVEFQAQQTMYQSALAAGTRIMQTSILDYL